MIEGVLRHCTDVEIDRQYTDTDGASIVGLATLLLQDILSSLLPSA